MKEKDIIFEKGDYWVRKAIDFKGYEVFKTGITHSVRVSRIGWTGAHGLEKAKQEIERRLIIDFSCGPTIKLTNNQRLDLIKGA